MSVGTAASVRSRGPVRARGGAHELYGMVDNQLIIGVGLNEASTRDENPYVPLTPREIAEDIEECRQAGASIIHLHARRADGLSDWTDVELYNEIWDEISDRCGEIVVYPTYDPSTQNEYDHVEALIKHPRRPLRILPSVTGSTNCVVPVGVQSSTPGGYVHVHNSRIEEYLDFARENDLFVSHDVMEPGGLRNFGVWSEQGRYCRPALLKFFMSDRWGFGLPPEVRYLQTYESLLPSGGNGEWQVIPYGVEHRRAMPLLAHAIGHGGHVRVGVGDSPSTNGFPARNADRVAQMVRLAADFGRPVATVEDVQARFGRLSDGSE